MIYFRNFIVEYDIYHNDMKAYMKNNNCRFHYKKQQDFLIKREVVVYKLSGIERTNTNEQLHTFKDK